MEYDWAIRSIVAKALFVMFEFHLHPYDLEAEDTTMQKSGFFWAVEIDIHILIQKYFIFLSSEVELAKEGVHVRRFRHKMWWIQSKERQKEESKKCR